MTLLLVAAAGGLGAVARYGVGVALDGHGFPWATLIVNVVGSLVLGAFLGGSVGRWDPQVVTAVTVGFLGAFTTYSTFSVETTMLLRDGRVAAAAAYVGASLLLGIGGAAAGYVATRGGS